MGRKVWRALRLRHREYEKSSAIRGQMDRKLDDGIVAGTVCSTGVKKMRTIPHRGRREIGSFINDISADVIPLLS